MSSCMQWSGKYQRGRFPGRRAGERGVALLITLALLALLGAASLAIIFLTSSDTMINGYYKNYRGSFYAAGSGATVAVEAMKNAISSAATPTATTAPLPVPSGITTSAGGTYAASLPTTVNTAVAPFEASYYSIGDTGSWSSQFKVLSATISNPTYTYSCNTSDSNCPTDNDYVWTFAYPYTVVVEGQSSGTGSEEVTETGIITYSSTPGTSASGGNPSFSKWAGFITNYALCSPGYSSSAGLAPGTMYGPFFTDGSWNFGNFSNPGYVFNGQIQQVGTSVGWIKNSQCTNGGSTAPSGFNAPQFNQGQLQTGVAEVDAPTNTYNQALAVLNGEGLSSSGTQTPMTVLKTLSGTSYPASGTAPNGVYFPYYTNSSGQLVYGSDPSAGGDGAGGGFYVNGDAAVQLTATTGGDGTSNPTQTYSISQSTTTTTGSGWNKRTTTTTTTTTVVVDATNNTTTVSSNGTTLTMSGIPQQLNPTTGQQIIQNDPSGNPVNPTMIYVNGQITGMSGTVQNNTGITVTATTGVDITGNITYLQQPVSSTDVLNSSTNAGVLGIYTQGNISLSAGTGGNLTVDASLAALSGNGLSGTSGFETAGSTQSCGYQVCNWTIVGGRSEDQAHGVSLGSGNTLYDQRFAGNFGPPWFPTATVSQAAPSIGSSSGITVTRTSWIENSR